MMEQDSAKQIGKHRMSFLAAGLFYLAGMIYIITALLSHNAVDASLGVMFVSIGTVWVAIGAKYKKEAQQK